MRTARNWQQSAAGFSLAELFVAIAIIGLLIALMLPLVRTSREASRRAQCVSNLKMIGIAMHNYHDTYKQLPFTSWSNQPHILNGQASDHNGHRGSILMKLIPYMEMSPYYDEMKYQSNNFTTSYGFHSSTNRGNDVQTYFDKNQNSKKDTGEIQFDDIHMPAYWCPSADSPKWQDNDRQNVNNPALTCYAACAGAQRVVDNGCHHFGIVPLFGDGTGDFFYGTNLRDPNPGSDNWAHLNRPRHTSGAFSNSYYGATFGEITDGNSVTFFAGEMLPNRKLQAWDEGWLVARVDSALGTGAPCNAPIRAVGGRAVAPHLSIDPTGTMLTHSCAAWDHHIYSWGFCSMHAGNGCNMLLGDGSVHFFYHTVDYTVWNRLGSRKDVPPVTIPRSRLETS